MTKFQYQVITSIKESEKGKVYLAAIEGYTLPVVVKELKYGNKEVYIELAKIENEHFPKLYHVEEGKDSLILVEEYIEGELLTDHLVSGLITKEKWLDIAEQICDALDVLHSHRPPLIHRDIKPSNIIINSEGIVKMIDFDSSRLYKDEANGDTRLLGTEKFAAPEQYGYSQTDCRSDIYSLGVVLGMFPKFLLKSKQKRWEELVKKCTLFAPENRFQTIQEVRKELKKIRRSRKVTTCKIGIAIGSCLLVCIFVGLCVRLLSIKKQDIKATLVKTDIIQIPDSILALEQVKTPPEWRDSQNDIPEYVVLKEDIRCHNSMVSYCFKDRMVGRDFLVHIREIEKRETQLLHITLYSYEEGSQLEIDSESVEIRNNVICIKEEYMQALKDGYYLMTVGMLLSNGDTLESCMYLYVANSDRLEEPQNWLQNTSLFFNNGENDSVNVVLKNDSLNEIVSVTEIDGTGISDSLFQIEQDGRVLQLSKEFLHQYMERYMNIFRVVGKDGSIVEIQINYNANINE